MANQKVTLKRVIDTAGNTDNILPTTDWDQVENKPSTFTPTAHNHAASEITSGTISTARLGSGTADNTTFLRGDNTWATVQAGSSNPLFEQNLTSTGELWWRVARVNLGSGGVTLRGVLNNHVESFGTQKLDLTIFGREADNATLISVDGTFEVAHPGVGVRVLRTTAGSPYAEYSVYIKTVSYTQAKIEVIPYGGTILTLGEAQTATQPSGSYGVEFDNTSVGEGAYYVGASIIRTMWHQGNLTPSNYVAKSGDTMTGNLTINTGAATNTLTLQSDNGYNSQVIFNNGATLRSAITSIGSAGNLAFYHNGGDKLVIDNSGNVGIGTTSPSSPLTVAGDIRTTGVSGNRARLLLVSSADQPNDLLFGANGTEYWSITSRESSNPFLGLYNTVGSPGWAWTISNATNVMDFTATPTVNGTAVSLAGHTHDDTYYTETEADGRFLNTAGDTTTGQLVIGTSGLAFSRNLTNNAIWFASSGADANHVLWNDYYGGPTSRGAAGSGFDGMKWNTFRGIHIRGGLSGGTNIIVAENSSGSTADHRVKLYASGNEKLSTNTWGVAVTGDLEVNGETVWHGGNFDPASYLTTSGKAADSELLDGLDSSAYLRDDGWNNYPGMDANAQANMKADFTYSNNAPLTGSLISFGANGYQMQFNSQYAGDGNELYFRSRQGDTGTWNSWKRVWHSGLFDIGNYLTTSNNSSLNSDSRNTRGVTRLYRRDDNSDFSLQHWWTGSYWYLQGYNADNFHANVQVGYANISGSLSGNFDSPGRNYSREWIEFPNYSGLYSPNNSAHFYPNNLTYGAWRVAGSKNGWGGFEFDGSNGQVVLMVSPGSNTVGFHNNSHGWKFFWESGTLYNYKNTYGGGTQATVWDSVNLTNLSQLTNGPGYINSTGTSARVFRSVSGTNTAELVRADMADNDQFRILVGGFTSNAGYAEIATSDDGTEAIYVRQYSGVFSTVVREAALLDGSGNTTFPGTVSAGGNKLAWVKTQGTTLQSGVNFTISGSTLYISTTA